MARNLKFGMVAGAAVIAGLVGTACGRAGEAGTVSVVAASAAATAHSQTVEIDSTVTQPGSTATGARMVYDFHRHVGEVFPTSGPDGQGGSSEVIFDGSTVYISLPGIVGGLPGVAVPPGKKWLTNTIPTNSANEQALTTLFDPLFPAGDMATLLSRLEPVVQSVHQDGLVVIGGVETTRYDLTVNAKHFNSMLGAGPKVPINPSGPIRLWVDSQSRVRQLQFAFSVPQLGQITETSDYTHFGIPVNVSIPPASEVETLQEFQRQVCANDHGSGDASSGSKASAFGCQAGVAEPIGTPTNRTTPTSG